VTKCHSVETRTTKLGVSVGLLLVTSALYSPAYGQIRDEIIVTAQKREQAIVDVPIAMTALTAEQLEKTRAKTIKELASLVPNFSFENVNGFNNISIRGVGGGGRGVGFDPRSGLYIDGVYIGQASALAQPLFGIKQVEVLRGPQGHLFGRNTVSGAVSLTTQAPSDEFGGSFRAVVGNENTYEAYGTLEGPLGEKVRGKINAAYETRDGFGVNEFTGNDIFDLERTTVRGQLSFLASEKLTIDVFADYSKTQTNNPVGEAQTGGAAAGSTAFPTPPFRVNTDVSPQDDNEVGGGSVTANYELDNGQKITSISAYRYSQQDRVNDTDYSPLDLVNIIFDDEYNQISQEFRLTSPDEQGIRYVVGLYYLNEDAKTQRIANAGTAFGFPATIPITINAQVDTNTYAAFASVDADITSAITLNMGARYTSEDKDIVYNFVNGPFLGLGVASNVTDKISETRFTPTIGATIALSEDINFYGKYATGFKSGGFNAGFLSQQSINDGFSFEAETVDSFEIGLKGSLMDGQLKFDMAAFVANYDNFQILQFVEVGPNLTDIQLRNAAKIQTKGIEFAATLYATDNLTIGTNVGLLNAEFDSFPNAAGAGVDFDGNKLPNSPNFTGTVTIDYHMSLPSTGGGIDFYSEFSHRDRSFSLGNNDPVNARIPPRDLVNGRITYSPDEGAWSVGLWSRNLLDKNYTDLRVRDFLGNETLRRGDPRTWGVELNVDF
jgi:iron complex outermembrane receptor protein